MPISVPVGLLWLATACLFITSALLLKSSKPWWLVCAPGIVLSQILIFLSWPDSRFGTIVNVVITLPVVIAFLVNSASGYRAQLDEQIKRGTERFVAPAIVTGEDLSHLPEPVRRYLHFSGAVGRPRVLNFRLGLRGRLRQGPSSTWMRFSAEQFTCFDPRVRAFYLKSSMYGVPLDGLHLYVGSTATMEIKLASLIKIVDGRGPEMNQSETVTMFNDMCVFAPATLIDESIRWEEIDSRTVAARFTNAGITIEAKLLFDAEGKLINFISNDRYQSTDGKVFRKYPWSTPIQEHREFDGRLVAATAEAVWSPPEGGFAYGEFLLTEIEYNLTNH